MFKPGRILSSPLIGVAVFFIVLILALGASRFSKSNDAHAAYVPPPLTVQTLGHDRQEPLFQGERYIGRVQAGQRVEVGFDISSTVNSIFKSEGEPFAEGEVLAVLDTERLKAKQKELAARYNAALAAKKLAIASLERAEGLKRSRSISEQALDEARQRREGAIAEVELVKAQQRSVDVELRKSSLKAPFDGVVVSRISDEGKTATPGAPILLLEQAGESEIRISLPLDKARTLQNGQTLAVYLDDLSFDVEVDRVNLALSQSRASEVYLRLSDNAPALVSGEIVSVELPVVMEQNGIWLPISALTEYGRGLWSVYLAKPEPGKASQAQIERTVVEIVQIRGESALVKGGLDRADVPHVISMSTHRIVAGQHVQVDASHQISQAH